MAKESPPPAGISNVLQQYVSQPDASYRWQNRRQGALGKGTYIELTLTSQTWRGIAWKHQLFIYRPSVVEAGSQALLLLAGGAWDDALEKAPDATDETLPGEAHIVAAIAESMHSPVAVLLQVPQQPLFDGLVEDELISFTFEKFLETGDGDWPLLLPMVKSAVRAMDAVQESAKSQWQLDIRHFLLTGASKRGWTTWLTAAVDPRVNALAPMVIDMLNMAPHMELQHLSFGGISEELHDYTEKGLPGHLHTERGRALQAIVDPYSYRRQLRQPKLIILGTNDPYWPVDALNLYWNDLEGEKYILYVPNNGHGLRDYPRIFGTVAALHKSLAAGKALPKLEWSFADRGDRLLLQLSTGSQPTAVTSWTAAAETRDFRKARWNAKPVAPDDQKGRSFSISLSKPSRGFAAVFAEAQFNGQSTPFYLSTNLRVIPTAETAAAAGGN